MKKVLFVFMLVASTNAFTQADDPADGDGTVPIDGGITLLLGVGTAYGIRVMRRRPNQQNVDA
jgi:hypothetical protein